MHWLSPCTLACCTIVLGACHSTEQTGPDTPLGYFHCYRLLVSVSVSASAGLFPFKAKCKDV